MTGGVGGRWYTGCGRGVGGGVGGGEDDGRGETAVGAIWFADRGDRTLDVVGGWGGGDGAGHRRRVVRVASIAIEWFGDF